MTVVHTVAESENAEHGAVARVSIRALPSALVPENVLSAISSLYEVETFCTSLQGDSEVKRRITIRRTRCLGPPLHNDHKEDKVGLRMYPSPPSLACIDLSFFQ